MNNTSRNIVILLLSGVALVVLYKVLVKDDEVKKAKIKEPEIKEPEPAVPQVQCPEGMVACAENPKKCYDPVAKYLVNPCK